ncbi:glycosyltransferase [Salinimicrobium sp. CAU 1759]
MAQILFKTQQFPHLTETFVLSQIILAIEEGHQVNILLQDLLDFEKSTHAKLLEKYKINEKIIIDKYDIPKNKIPRLFKALKILLRNFKDLGKWLKYIRLKSKFSLTWIYEFDFYKQFQHFDIIHVQYGTNVHPVDLIKRVGLISGRLIVSFHGHDAFFPINGFIENNGYYDHLFRGNNLIVANTPYLAEKIETLGCRRKNIKIIPVPVDVNFFQPIDVTSKKNPLKLITVGRLDPIKGHRLGIEFVKILIDGNINAHFTIVGEGEEHNSLTNMIKDLQLEEVVDLVGRKNQEEIKALLQASDIYIFTGVPVKQGRRETQGLATLEAQACGLPVLAFDSGGVKYTIKEGQTGYLCPEFDLDCMSKSLSKLLDTKARKRMGTEARSFVEEHFSTEVIAVKWRKIYGN